MTEFITKTDKNGKSHIKVKFHETVIHYKRVETLKYHGKFYRVYINKYNQVYNLEESVVTAWKEVEKGKKKIRIPDKVVSIPQPEIMNKVRNQHYNIATTRILAELEKLSNS